MVQFAASGFGADTASQAIDAALLAADDLKPRKTNTDKFKEAEDECHRPPKPTKAVIYCRVSSKRQVKEGHGLDSQETRCREHAKRLGYSVLETFPDKAVSGGKLHRPSFNRLLAFVEAQDSAVAVIIDDRSRFSRDIESHWALRRALSAVGGKLESPSVQFGEDAHSILIENLLASV
eukprot:CAMPEP_0184426068 /NCGR_PEP_ID=MMETSP0738-20130409/145328_1 /TAXON_ID=385413 /ORGANISM="Thalassiosira miniscula, Strain CCMP1093" /LENGTH=177 /DNA_ID=CAMNT_0026789147 /DNA_START=239 /DNA_END=769 /DNA_ORIENTATION=+